jgi:hypothetical protein
MFQLKHFAVLVLPLVCLSSAAIAQDSSTESIARVAANPALRLPSPTAGFALDAASSGTPTGGYVRVTPPAPGKAKKEKKDKRLRPFRSVAIGFSANSLGAGVEVATPVLRSFNLRSTLNVFSFDYPFTIDGVNYDARLHLKSGGAMLDWFPLHRGFHISPGILYVKNTVTSGASVGPGQSFELGSQPFTNSVDDPVSGSAALAFPRKYAPMLLLGFGNIIPRSGRHLSFPVEFGAAYTGAPQLSVNLSGTACANQQGCLAFAGNQEAQSSVKQEIYKLNEDLKRVPAYPIVSIGVAYHF